MVITLVAVLLAILLPAMARAKEAARQASCGSNVRQMAVGWHVALADYDERIGRTSGVGVPPGTPTWIQMLRKSLPRLPSVAPTSSVTFNSCPTVIARGRPVEYFALYSGYAVNIRWEQPSDPFNDLELWSRIRKPSLYPWFTDVEVNPLTATTDWAPDLVPQLPTAAQFQNYGVGAHHAGGFAANVGYAEGSVRTIRPSEIHAAISAPGRYEWFENR